jgi:hypothetical protein
MKTFHHLFLFLLLAFISALPTQSLAQLNVPDSADGLSVSAIAILIPTGDPKLYVTIQLLNTTNHDITVLTKTGSSSYFNLSSDKTKFRFWFWFDFGSTTLGGHLIVPSLPELAPVTIKPNEVALCHMMIGQNDASKTLQGLTKDSPIVISYEVSRASGARFGCWNGRIDTKPFHIQ